MSLIKQVYFLTFLEWIGDRNISRCYVFEAKKDSEARATAKVYLESIKHSTSWAFLKCVTERRVKL